MAAMTTVRRAEPGDQATMAAMYARAFDDDPVWSFIFPDAGQRPTQSAHLFSAFIKAHLRDGETLVADDIAGAAVWAPPGKWQIPMTRMIGEVPRLLKALGRRSFGLLGDLQRIERLHARFTSDPHFYLAVLGTDPPRQGKGIGSAVMTPVLARCDQAGLGAYLESSKESNVPFYRRHGFEVVGEFTFRNGPTMWPMWREARPPVP
jgi:GNAT superfamily N-acetyltransferase